LFYFAFGGLVAGDGEFELPVTGVVVANLDRAQMGFSGGQMVADALAEAVPGIIQVSFAEDAAAARAAVDRQDAAVAVIIPSEFTAAILDPDGQAAIQLYQDPTLSLGPGIVKGIVEQMVDVLVGSKVATEVAAQELAARGLPVDAESLQNIAMEYGQWSQSLEQDAQSYQHPFLEVRFLSGDQADPSDMSSMIGLLMAGMMVFFVFFTGAASAQSILTEEEAGTLSRLFTTPTQQSTILGGKYLASFFTLAVQVIVLVIVAALAFGINWGPPVLVASVILGLVVLASSFGIFINSWLKDSRQAGIVFGGVLTAMGLLAMMGIFTAVAPGTSSLLSTAALFVPQGWAVRGWQLLLTGGRSHDILLTVAVMVVLSLAFFGIGVFRFRRRYA
jgi:ABC-2 type transport system permease protein